ncbi:metal ABC transporter ATP-binding protein [candidate division KSB1 bacterium]|nr:metal ABC transporter ATP-binding protein [candidate division KSB1 bacterium]
MNETKSIIEIEELTFRYGEAAVLREVSLRVEAGEFLGIIGPNGGGKTTLLRILLGLETEYDGRVEMFGETPHRSFGWRARTGVVPQTRELPPRYPALVRDVVEMGTTSRKSPALSRGERRERVDEALTLVGIESLANRPLWELSGGQRQRVFIARALACRPQLLLLDEPTVGVDQQGQDLLLSWIAKWRSEHGMAVVLVSHDVGVIAPLADRLACLNILLHFHDRPDKLTGEAIEKAYGCPAEVIFHDHGVPHRVLRKHRH